MMLHVLIRILALSSLHGSSGHALQGPSATYGLTDLQQWANQLTKLQGTPEVSVELSSEPVLLSISSLPGKVLLNAAYFPDRMSVEEAKAALARELGNLRVAAQSTERDLIQWPALFGMEPPVNSYGSLSLQGRIRAIDNSLSLLRQIGVSPVAMLTLHEVEAQESAQHLSIIEGLLIGKWTDIMASVRKKVSQLDDSPRRSAVSNFFRVRTVSSETTTAFWFRDIKLFELPSMDGARSSETLKGLNAFFDAAPQPLEVRITGKALRVGKVVLQLDSEDAASEGRQRVIKAVALWREMAVVD